MMKLRAVRSLALVSVFMLALLPAGAAERLCSVYVESVTALQQQVQKAAEVFESPELGMFPMMMTMVVPGGSQLNVNEPVSLHIFDLGNGKTGGVLELTPATTAEMFLKAVTAAGGMPLAPAVDGRFTFDGGVAQVSGTRLLLAQETTVLDLCAGSAVPALPPMPAMEGAIRVAMAPSAVVPTLTAAKAKWQGFLAAAGPDAAQVQESMDMIFGIYIRALSQINALNISVAVRSEGLVVREHMVPVSGSTIAGIINSMKPVTPTHLSFVDKDALFSLASGSFSMPDQLKRQITALYAKMMKASPLMADVDSADLVTAMQQSLDVIGASMVFSGGMSPDGKHVQMQGAMGINDSVAYMNRMLEVMKLPVYQTMMNQSGMKIAEAVKRMYKDVPVYNWAFSIDDEMLRKMVSQNSPDGAVSEEAFDMAKRMMSLFGCGYDYAAAPQGLAFGMGTPAMVEQAVDRLVAGGAASAEAARIKALLSPSVSPVVLGRFSLLDAVRLSMKMQAGIDGTPVSEAVAALPKGEGIVFADSVEGGEVNCTMLIPATDVKAMVAFSKTVASATAAQGEEDEDDDMGGGGDEDQEEDGAAEDK